MSRFTRFSRVKLKKSYLLKIWQISCLRCRWQGFYLEVFSVTAQQNCQTGKFNFTIVIETCLNFQQLLESGAKTDFTKEQVNCGHNCKIVIFNERAREFSQVLGTSLFSQCFNICKYLFRRIISRYHLHIVGDLGISPPLLSVHSLGRAWRRAGLLHTTGGQRHGLDQ